MIFQWTHWYLATILRQISLNHQDLQIEPSLKWHLLTFSTFLHKIFVFDHFSQFDKVFCESKRHDIGLCLHISCHAVAHFLSKLNSDAEKIVWIIPRSWVIYNHQTITSLIRLNDGWRTFPRIPLCVSTNERPLLGCIDQSEGFITPSWVFLINLTSGHVSRLFWP